MKKVENIENLRIFCAVAALGSARAAGERLNIEPSNVFRTIRAMEAEFGLTCFDRETRPMQLTPDGKRFLDYSKRIVELSDAMADELGGADRAGGVIRVAAPAGTREAFVVPAAVEYQEAHPDVSIIVKVLVSGSPDFLSSANGEANDVVVTLEPTFQLPEGTVVRRCGKEHFVACASASYVAKYGAPVRPSECLRHAGLLLHLPCRDSVEFLSKGGETEKLEWRSRMAFTSQLNARDAMLLGGGVIPDMSWALCRESVKKGEAVVVMRGWCRPDRTMCVVSPGRSERKVRVARFAEWLAARGKKRMREIDADWRRLVREAPET